MEPFFLLGRVMYGGYFVMTGMKHFQHKQMLVGYGTAKGLSAPSAAVSLSGLLLIAAGLSIIFGVWIKAAVALLVIFLSVVSFTMHAYWRESDPMAKMGDMTQFMKNMALLGAALMLPMIREPWLWSMM